MKRSTLLSAFLLFFITFSFAAHVNVETAQIVGRNFLSSQAVESNQTTGNLQLVYRATTNIQTEQETLFYIFQGTEGFVIVAGDDRSTPILAYSNTGSFNVDNMPPNARKWLEGYKSELRHLISANAPQPESIRNAWSLYTEGIALEAERAAAVSPLVNLTWNQSPHYNALCPGGSVTGCVATAMAQIMKYWEYPATGSGFHSYNHSTYGTLSANFGSTTYDWSAMPSNVTSSNNAVATLMYHCGVSVDMDYSPQVSGAYVISDQSPVQHCSEYALKNYFGYATSMHGELRANYSESQWISMLKAELDASRPILYAGFGSGGGHAFVCDGYDNNNFFHFNWGWGGAYDGYFAVGALNPSGTGTGGGTGGYNSGQQVLIGIEPANGGGGGGGGAQTFDIALYDYVAPSASTIYYGQSFSVSSNFLNQGQNTFNGDYCAAVFDAQGTFIDYVEILSGYSLQSGYVYTNNLVFSSSGLLSMLPGTYTIGVFYKPTGGNWVAASNNGSYVNAAQIQVINPNYIEMNSNMVASPSTTIQQGQNLSVNLNVVNTGSSNYFGDYQVNLYHLDGSFAQNIGTLTESNGLPPNYTYLDPFLTFSNTVSVSPGTYLLATMHLPAGSSNFEIVGSSNFQNPIYLTVQAATISPDQYETNNSFNQGYVLSANFSGNTANANTTGANLHTGEDNDFYKINLPAGFDYTIAPRLHDSYNSGNGNTYTVDALFSYSTDGNAWSDAFDDVASGSLVLTNGGTVTFHVAPYFAGETGSYLLDVDITRSPTTSISEPEALQNIRIYPNPATNIAVIDLQATEATIKSMELLSIDGKTIETFNTTNHGNKLTLPLNQVGSGVYFLRLISNQGMIIRKIAVSK